MQLLARPGVTFDMKRLAVVVAIAAVVGLAWYLRRPSAAALGPGTAAAATSSSAAPSTTSPPVPSPPRHVTRLATAGERQRIADRIASAQAGRAAIHAPAPPSLPALPAPDPDDLKTTLRAAMREVSPMLGDCFARSHLTELSISARLTLGGDPDVGTLIDAHQLFDDHARPLPAELDDCLRATFQSLELPPLAEGAKVDVTYPFVFRNQ